MFGLGPLEMVIILAVALVFIGPGKLPEVARSLGKGMREMRRAVAGFEGEVQRATAPIDEPATPDPDSHEGLFPPGDPRAETDKGAEGEEDGDEPGPPDRVAQAQARPVRPAGEAEASATAQSTGEEADGDEVSPPEDAPTPEKTTGTREPV